MKPNIPKMNTTNSGQNLKWNFLKALGSDWKEAESDRSQPLGVKEQYLDEFSVFMDFRA